MASLLQRHLRRIGFGTVIRPNRIVKHSRVSGLSGTETLSGLGAALNQNMSCIPRVRLLASSLLRVLIAIAGVEQYFLYLLQKSGLAWWWEHGLCLMPLRRPRLGEELGLTTLCTGSASMDLIRVSPEAFRYFRQVREQM